MAELERFLRKRKYFQNALITADDEQKNIRVETWDNWSLMPTVSFGRKGGVNAYSFGIKDRNLLGLGIDAEIESYTNSQRSGYKFDSQIPLFQNKNIELSIKLADNDDGEQQKLSLIKPFVSNHTDKSYTLGFNNESRVDTIFQNGTETAIFAHSISYQTANFAWLSTQSEQYLLRYRVGLTKDKHLFSESAILPNVASNNIDDDVYTNSKNINSIPTNRNFTYPWVEIQYLEQNYEKLNNIHLISQIEDFNFGWQIRARLGIGQSNEASSTHTLWRASIDKGFPFSDRTLMLFNFTIELDHFKTSKDRWSAQFDTKIFYRLSEQWGLYFNNVNTVSKNRYIDEPISLGGDNGVRGFPLQYQHGENSFRFTEELRYYPKINLFKLFDLAGTVFIDSGIATGDSNYNNKDESWLHSIGIGARLYSPHATSSRQIVHIDLIKPFSQNEEIEGFVVRLQAKQSF